MYVDNDKTLIILINFTDHLQVISMTSNMTIENITAKYNEAANVINKIEQSVQYQSSRQFGYLTTNPCHIGSGVTMTVLVKVYNIHTKKIIGGSFDELIDDLNGAAIIKNDYCLIKSINHFSLSHETELSFIESVFSRMMGLIYYDKSIENQHELNFKKYELPSNTKDSFLQKAYDSTYSIYKYHFSPYGVTLNQIMAYYLNDQLNPFGILLHDKTEFNTFKLFIYNYIYGSQSFNIELTNHMQRQELSCEKDEFMSNDKITITNTSICLIRNIDFPFPASQHNKNDIVEQMIIKALMRLNSKYNHHSNAKYGEYYSLTGEQRDYASKIIEENQLILFHREEMKKFQMDFDFPKHRGVIQFHQEHIFAVVNDVDHIKFFLSSQLPIDSLHRHFLNLLNVVNEFSHYLKFLYDIKLGFLTSSPRFIGTGLLLKIKIRLGSLKKESISDVFNSKEFAWSIIRESESNQLQVELVNKYTIGLSETELVMKLLSYLKKLY